MKVIGMIPARVGSQRLKCKNLALIDGKPLLAYAIEAALHEDVFDAVYVNADSTVFQSIAEAYGVSFYLRPEALGSSATTADEVAADFLAAHPCETLVWVNTTSPLQPLGELAEGVRTFQQSSHDMMVSVREEQVHAVCRGKPVNFEMDRSLAQTQTLDSVFRFVYSFVAWRTQSFLESYASRGYGFFCGDVGYFPVSKRTSILVKNKEDLALVRAIQESPLTPSDLEVTYFTPDRLSD